MNINLTGYLVSICGLAKKRTVREKKVFSSPQRRCFPAHSRPKRGRLLKACLSLLNTFSLKAKTYMLASSIAEPVPYSRV